MGLRCWTAQGSTRPRKDKARDTVKNLLLNKLIKKFGKLPGASTVIPSRINKFIMQNKLTQANFAKLEKEIADALKNPSGNQAQIPKPQPAAPQPPVAEKPIRPASAKPQKQQEQLPKPKKEDNDLERADSFDDDRQRVEYNEDKDWDAILRFNAELYQEEIRQEEEKKKHQKAFMKSELDKQMEEKNKLKAREDEEHHAYTHLQKTHLGFLERKEKEKDETMRKNKVVEKERLDKQLRDEKNRKKLAEMDEKNQKRNIVDRIKLELEEERVSAIKKKQIERDYHKKMIEENEENKKKQTEKQRLDKEQENKDLAQYTKMLDQQEADRIDEIKSREKKTQDLMNKMADTVLKDLDKKRQLEEKKMFKYQQDKELLDKLDDEERLKRIKENQKEMRQYLDKQTQEKRDKEAQEKQVNSKQADIWKKEINLYAEEEKSIRQKIWNVNKQHADFLKDQMASNKKGPKKVIMNREEFLMNKKLLEDIDTKVKEKNPDPK